MEVNEIKTWVGLLTPVLSIVVIPAVLWWLSRTFPSRSEVSREIDGLRGRITKAEERLDSGAQRFVEMEAAIREVNHAASEAHAAADDATKAANQIADIRVALSDLKGEIKVVTALLQRVERNAGLLIEGHLDTGKE